MPLNLNNKQAIVEEIADIAQKATSAITADYRGLTVAQMTEFRRKARDAGVYVRVVRNTLAKRAFENTVFACLEDSLVGPLVFCFAFEEPGAAARLLYDFCKDNNELEVKALTLGEKLLTAKDLKAVADLPNRQQALGTLAAVFKAPINKFAQTTTQIYEKLVRVLAAIGDKKSAQ